MKVSISLKRSEAARETQSNVSAGVNGSLLYKAVPVNSRTNNTQSSVPRAIETGKCLMEFRNAQE